MSINEELVLKPFDETKQYVNIFEKRYEAGRNAGEPIDKSKLKGFKKNLIKLRSALVGMVALTLGDSYEISKDMLKIVKRSLSKVADFEIDEKVTNQHLEDFSLSLYEDLKLNLYVLEQKGLEIKEWAKENRIPIPSISVLETVAKAFHSNRKDGISVFDYKMGEGEHLLAFKENVSASEVYTYGTDRDAEKCQVAKDNGVYKVAKEGLKAMTGNTFDIALFFMNQFTFFEPKDIYYHGMSEEEERFHFFLMRKAARSGGYIIFNLPYYRIPQFQRKINGQLKIEEIYRTDDEAGNLIFVTTLKQPDVLLQSKQLRSAFLNPKKLDHYEDIDRKFVVEKGDLILPETFRPMVIDERDHLESFKDAEDDLDIIQDIFEPKEKVVELNSPLQAYNPGHIPAMATTGVTDGIKDTSIHPELVDGFNYSHISSSKIIQQDVEEKDKEMYKGKLVDTVTLKKRTILVFKTLQTDGTIKELLNTK